mgnify:CR=1 FL=1
MVIASIIISFGGLLMRNITTADPWQIVFYRAVGFTFAILVLLLIKNKKLILINTRKIGFPGFLAGVFHAIANILFIHALANTSVANSLFTLSSIPFITAILAFLFLKEKLSQSTFIIMLFAFLGIAIMVKGGLVYGGLLGNILSLLTAISFSIFTILLRKYRKIDMFPTLLVTGLLLIFFSFFININNFYIPLKDLVLCLFWGAIMSGFVNAIFIFCTRYLLASEVTFFMLLEFALGPFWVWIFINEKISFETFFGGLIVMVSVAIYSLIETIIAKKNKENLKKFN